ncbi:MAG: hypothetical protein MMC23_003083 [Stictis urceolatum]|nr:hypothetical protein [Stictis urceolata]
MDDAEKQVLERNEDGGASYHAVEHSIMSHDTGDRSSRLEDERTVGSEYHATVTADEPEGTTASSNPISTTDLKAADSPDSPSPKASANAPISVSNENEPSEEEPEPPSDSTAEPPSEQPASSGPEFSVFTTRQKRAIIFAGSLAAFISPLSSQIYFPALNTIAADLHQSISAINLTVTMYLIIQGVAPTFIGGLSDVAGRRIAYMVCLAIYTVANLALALQNSYPALMVLRCLQSGGSSATVALSVGLVGDLVTSAERGQYIAIASVAAMFGPTISPVIGGAISNYAGWHWIFWFLLIFGMVFFIPFLLFLPETCRAIVGNGSIPPQKLNMSLTDYLRHRRTRHTSDAEKAAAEAADTQSKPRSSYWRTANPLRTVALLRDPATLIILLAVGLGNFCFYAISTAAASQFRSSYHLTDIQISLMFLPIGVGSIVSALTMGKLVDANYARHARKRNMPVVKNRAVDLSDFPLERARLEIVVPMHILAAVSVVAYGWVLQTRPHIAVPAVVLFFAGGTITGEFQVLNVLLVDLHSERPAAVAAVNNLVRCELGAVASAVVGPAIGGIGSGWTFTLFGAVLGLWLGVLWGVAVRGIEMRRRRREREGRRVERKE